MLLKNTGRAGKRFLCVLMVSVMLGATCDAETVSVNVSNAEKARLAELGYLAEEHYSEDDAVAAAIRGFKIGNGLSEDSDTDEAAMILLMSENARSQAEYLSAKAQSLHEQGMLSVGAFGDPVKKMQKALTELGYFHDECNGAFNESTEYAVKRFQLACGLNVTGVADSSVFLRLYEGEPKTYEEFLQQLSCKRGDTGDNVRTLQVWLKKLGASGFSVTGSYGALTARAVKNYQRTNGLEETGNADTDTIQHITEAIFKKDAENRGVSAEVDRDALAELLKQNNYEPGTGSNGQLKLALMKYQFAHGIPVTGETDEETIHALQNGVLPVTRDEPVEAAAADIAGFAYGMIGTRIDFDSYYGFPEYVNLLFEREMPKESEVQVEQIYDVREAEPGDTLMIVEADRILWGIRAEKDGVLCEIDGMVVLYYPETDVTMFRVVP